MSEPSDERLMRQEAAERAWADVALAVRLLSVDPHRLGGILLRGRPGPVRDRILGWIRARLPPEAPVARIPLHVTEDRLLGGLSLADTLRSGRVVREQGLLARCHGGVAIVAMAERLEPHVVSHLGAALDRAELILERESISEVVPCRIGAVVLDEGIDDERVATALRDRLALAVRMDELDGRMEPEEPPPVDELELAAVRERLAHVELGQEAVEALCAAAVALGIPSLRAVILAAMLARVHAALEGRMEVESPDLDVAARLVLGPRATQLAAPPPVEDEDEEQPADEEPLEAEDSEPTEPQPPPPRDDDEAEVEPDPSPHSPSMDEVVLEAAKSGIPAGLLDMLSVGTASRRAPRKAGQAGAAKNSMLGGRPAGTLAAPPDHGTKLHVLETLRAAAPWQRLRGGDRRRSDRRRLEVRKEDFRVRRFQQRTETCVIFAVDASGSSAAQRLAEAKGAVERVLADCYARRDHVALIAFRGKEATLVLPPTRSLARVKRRLAALAGGGATPLAAGIDASLALANDSRKKGRTPLVVLMTDGRGNVARDGQTGSKVAREDAVESSRRLRGAGVPTLLLDTGPRSRPRVRHLAAEMNARYIPLPRLDTAGVSREIQSLAQESACR